jgi:(S)-3,5-dihydroxyphenylglycine transaminase
MHSRLMKLFDDPLFDVMNFLNEVVQDYSSAISFAPGRPLEMFFDVETHCKSIAEYVRNSAEHRCISPQEVWMSLGQYGRTNGSINEAIALQLKCDEQIMTSAHGVLVTVGAQEAMLILLLGLFQPNQDVLLVSDPSYIGISGIARMLGIRTIPVASGPDGITVDSLSFAISRARLLGTPKAIYDIPDFHNPSGTRLPFTTRLELLDLCHREDILFIEDNPYGMFSYDGVRLPTLKALDRYGVVVYIASFSKVLFPGLRIGALVADQTIRGKVTLAQELSKVKSFTTVNSPAISQAIVENAISTNGGSLETIVAPRRDYYRQSRDILTNSLRTRFQDLVGTSWNQPQGGFFVTMKIPFEFGIQEVRHCAAEYGVIACPMSFFSISDDRLRELRLSFSYLHHGEIDAGVERLFRFCIDKIRQSHLT